MVFLSDGFAAIVPTILAGSFIFLCITVEFLQHARLVKAIFIFIALKFYENTVNKEAVLISSLCLLLSLAITYFTAVSTFFEKIVIETGAKAAATATIVLYTIVVLTLILRRTIAQLFVKKAICICFAVAVLSTLFCFVNSFLSAILVVDALNMCLYILFFVYIDSNNADSFISSIATFF